MSLESTITLNDAETDFLGIVERALNGEEFIVTRMGQPVIRIGRFEGETGSRKLGDLAGQIQMREDFDEWSPELTRALEINDSR